MVVTILSYGLVPYAQGFDLLSAGDLMSLVWLESAQRSFRSVPSVFSSLQCDCARHMLEDFQLDTAFVSKPMALLLSDYSRPRSWLLLGKTYYAQKRRQDGKCPKALEA